MKSLAGAVWPQPVVGLGIVAAPAPYVLWTDKQHALVRFSIRPEADPCA